MSPKPTICLGITSSAKEILQPVVQHVREALQRQLPAALHDDAYYLLGRSALETGQYTEALEAFQPLIKPGHSGRWHEAALYWSGEALLQPG